jgi:predicted HTH transcriptional regulator
MTNVAATSLDAFFDLKKSTKLQEQQRKIISVMQPNVSYTRRDLAELTKLETSTVSARINGMIDTHVEIIGTVKDMRTGKTVQALILKAAA